MEINRPKSAQPIPENAKKVADMNLDAGEKITLKLVSFDDFLKIAINKNFVEKEIIPKVYEAKLYPKKREELEKLFNPKM